MEKTTSILKTSTKFIVIAIIIVVLIFLSFLMVSLVPRILSSMANTTVSITSAFFPSGNKNATNTATSSGISLNGPDTTATNAGTGTSSNPNNSSKGDFLSNFFGPRKNNNTDQSVNFSVATSSRQNSNNGGNNNSSSNNSSNNSYHQPNSNYSANTGTPDLSVQILSVGTKTNGVFTATNNFTTDSTVVVNFQITNQGTAASGEWAMRVVSPSSNAMDKIKTLTARSLPAGAAVTGQVVFNTPAVGTNQQITISIDPNNTIREINKTNNQISSTINVTQANNYYNYNNYNNCVNGYTNGVYTGCNNNNNNYNYNNCVNGYVNGVYTGCNNNNNNYNNCVNGYVNGVYTGCTNNYNYNNCVNGYMNGVYTGCTNNYNTSLPNLSANLIALGKVDINNQFTQTTYFKTTDKVAIKFTVTNNSSVYTSSWSWKANIVGPSPYFTGTYYNNYNIYGYTYNSDGSRTYSNPTPETGLAPGETRTYTATFDGATYGSNYMTIIVDSANSITESNEGDNSISQSFFVNY